MMLIKVRFLKLMFALLATILFVEFVSWLVKDGGYEVRELIFYLRCVEMIVWTGILGFHSKRELIKNLTLSIVSAGGILLLTDVLFFILILTGKTEKDPLISTKSTIINRPDSALGYKPSPDTTFSSLKKYGGLPVYDYTFSTNKFSHRISPNDTMKNKADYALFFGCSVTFGEGVHDSETIPARFSAYNPEYHAYNFGYSGYGTQEMLANLQQKGIRKEIAESKGVAFYIFINPHVNRAIGDMNTTNLWGADLPYYYENGDTLIRRGTFLKGRWFLTHLYILLGRSSTLKYFKVNFPAHINDRHFRFVTKMIRESFNEYVSKFGNHNFYVIIFPGEATEIIPYLKGAGIRYLDYSHLFNPHTPGYSFEPYDPHPTARADAIFAGQLSRDIEKLQP